MKSIKLVERTTRSVTMTTEGAAYHERALKVLADLDEMDGAVGGSRSAPEGSCPSISAPGWQTRSLSLCFQTFSGSIPDIDLMLGVSDRAADLVGEGSIASGA